MDKDAKLACCAICTLSDAMKRCKTCTFNPIYVNLSSEKVQAAIQVELKKELEGAGHEKQI